MLTYLVVGSSGARQPLRSTLPQSNAKIF
jgi:hypothetical protein